MKTKEYYTLLKGGFFDSRIAKSRASGCWKWKGTISPQGYATAQIMGGKPIRVHRYIYELVKTKIPKGLCLDHLCRNRACVNPEHLEIVTTKVNTLRGIGVTALNAKKTHCGRGHKFTKENTYIYTKYGPKWRHCITCKNENTNRYRREKRVLTLLDQYKDKIK